MLNDSHPDIWVMFMSWQAMELEGAWANIWFVFDCSGACFPTCHFRPGRALGMNMRSNMWENGPWPGGGGKRKGIASDWFRFGFSVWKQDVNEHSPKSWHSPAICTQRMSLLEMRRFGCLSFRERTSCPARWHTLYKQSRITKYGTVSFELWVVWFSTSLTGPPC